MTIHRLACPVCLIPVRGVRNVCCLLVMPIALGQASLRVLRGFTQRDAGASLRAGRGDERI